MELVLRAEQPIYKRIYNFKEKQRDGLCATITNKDGHRLSATCFDNSGAILLASDFENAIFAIDFSSGKYWTVATNIGVCTLLTFSPFTDNAFLAGTQHGHIYIIGVQTGRISGILKGHKTRIKSITFAMRDSLCLTSTKIEAILWNLATNCKVQVLNLRNSTFLKHAYFIPVLCDILTSFDDQIVHIWNCNNFEVAKQLQPNIWHNHAIKTVAFTLDGKIMVFGFDSPCLALFQTRNYNLFKFLTLPEYVHSIKYLKFISAPNDGGANRNLIILSGQGIVYFYNFENERILGDLQTDDAIVHIECCNKNNLISCIMSAGNACVYDVTHYIFPIPKSSKRTNKKLRRCPCKTRMLKENIREVLSKDKLTLILKEYGEYPDSYRTKIWEQLLQLPDNRKEYNAIINNRIIESFPDLHEQYPLESKRSMKNLHKLLDNLVTWSSFFAHVEFLPVFVFPFVKLFYDKPLVCFEVVCTILLNCCQYWFEYYPLPPVNILAMIENMILENDCELVKHFAMHKIPSTVYAWPLLESSFSEVLTAVNWKIFWDHVLTNETSFLLCATAAYNILHRQNILQLNEEKQFRLFYYTHHPIDLKKLLSKTYQILNCTSDSIHPRQYLKEFRRLPDDHYPNFTEYPKDLVTLKECQEKIANEKLAKIQEEETTLINKRLLNIQLLDEEQLKREEETRILEMENAMLKKLAMEHEEVRKFQKKLAHLRANLQKEQLYISARTKHSISTENTNDLSSFRAQNSTKTSHRCKTSEVPRKVVSILHEFNQKNWNQGEERELEDENCDTTLNIINSIAAVESLVARIESALKNGPNVPTDEPELETDAKELVEDINKLLKRAYKSGKVQSQSLKKRIAERDKNCFCVEKSVSY